MRLSCGVQVQEGEAPGVAYRTEAQDASWDGLRLALRPDLVLAVSRLDGPSGARFDFEIEAPPVHFGFVVSGRNRCTYRNGRFRNQEHLLESGGNSILCLPSTSGQIQCDPQSGSCVMAILVTPAFLTRYLGGDQGAPPEWLRGVLEQKPEQFLWRGRPNPCKTALVERILGGLGAGPAQRLLLESMVLELLARQLEECCLESGRPVSPVRITRGDVERLHEASRLLVRDLEAPPGLAALAQAVGLSDKKLKYGFRQVFGMAVYEYFRSHRLERARELLDGGGLSVSEVAYRVGYLNLSHFSQAFRSRYGVNPRDYAQGRFLPAGLPARHCPGQSFPRHG